MPPLNPSGSAPDRLHGLGISEDIFSRLNPCDLPAEQILVEGFTV